MTQEDIDLLLQDLCGRIPYGVKCEVYDRIGVLDEISSYGAAVNYDNGEDTTCRIEYIKPYLFPLSSMTEEQKKELDKKFLFMGIYGNNIQIHYHSQGYWDTDLEVDFQDWLWLINWLNKNHFDYRGLIEKGLAVSAIGLNIY
jgi:hypothetical protein